VNATEQLRAVARDDVNAVDCAELIDERLRQTRREKLRILSSARVHVHHGYTARVLRRRQLGRTRHRARVRRARNEARRAQCKYHDDREQYALDLRHFLPALRAVEPRHDERTGQAAQHQRQRCDVDDLRQHFVADELVDDFQQRP
jgi:hypothetical protein